MLRVWGQMTTPTGDKEGLGHIAKWILFDKPCGNILKRNHIEADIKKTTTTNKERKTKDTHKRSRKCINAKA